MTKWHNLSPNSRSLIDQLIADAGPPSERAERTGWCLRSLRALQEPAAIPSIIGFLADCDRRVTTEATATLSALYAIMPLAHLPILDEHIRTDGWWAAPIKPADVTALRVVDNAALAFGLISCHSNGYVRQAALSRLDREMTTGEEIPFLLLRLNDWVVPVRRIAEDAIQRRLTEAQRAAYLANLPLIIRLQGRDRSGNSPAFANIRRLIQSDVTALVDAALASADRLAQRAALTMAWEASGADESKQNAMIGRVLGSDEPSARLHLATLAGAGKLSAPLQRQVMRGLLDDRFVAVRRLALGWCAAREPGEHRATLHAALLDPSAKMRSIAQFHLPRMEGIDLPTFYRDAIKRGGANLKPALAGLGETGRAVDAKSLVAFAKESALGIRKVALSALAKLALDDHLETFLTALQDKSPGVSRQARRALESRAQTIGAKRLSDIFNSRGYSHVRIQTFRLINQLSKWQKLPFLIEIAAQRDDPLQASAENFLHSWLGGFNATHCVQPTPSETARFRAVIATYGPQLKNQWTGIELRALAESIR